MDRRAVPTDLWPAVPPRGEPFGRVVVWTVAAWTAFGLLRCGLWWAACKESIKRRIAQRTGGRIRLLRVETIGSRVVICGSAPSYYVKQLALRGACDVLGSAAANQIELNVEVSGSS